MILELPDEIKLIITSFLNIGDLINFNNSVNYKLKENNKRLNNERYKRINNLCKNSDEIGFRFGILRK